MGGDTIGGGGGGAGNAERRTIYRVEGLGVFANYRYPCGGLYIRIIVFGGMWGPPMSGKDHMA